MGRRRLSRYAALVACLMTVTAAFGGVQSAGAAQPNILVIVTDDQRQGTTHVMPNTRHFLFDDGRYSHEAS